MKPKQKITFTSIKRYGTCSEYDWVTGRQTEQKCAKFRKNVSIFGNS